MIDIKIIAVFFLIGFIVGFITAVKLKAGGTEISNNIRKIKTDEGLVTVDQSMPSEIKIETKKRHIKRFFQSIFSRKNK